MSTAFKGGDRVQRRKESNYWHTMPKERGAGTVTAVVHDGTTLQRIDVWFDNGELAQGWEAAFFELVL